MRLIDADALYEVVSEHVTTVSVCPTVDWARGKSQMKELCLEDIANAPTVDRWISVKEAANIIAELFGDDCACNFNGIDEWLPQYCEHTATDCPHTAGTTCWEQYIKYLSKRLDIGRKEGERNGKRRTPLPEPPKEEVDDATD